MKKARPSAGSGPHGGVIETLPSLSTLPHWAVEPVMTTNHQSRRPMLRPGYIARLAQPTTRQGDPVFSTYPLDLNSDPD